MIISIKVSKSVLLKHLTPLNSLIISNPMLPILENVVFAIKDNLLSLTAFDMNDSLTSTLEVSESTDGIFLMPYKFLVDTIKLIAEQVIEIESNNETFVSTILTNNGKYKLAGENPLHYPAIPKFEEIRKIDIKSSILKQTLDATNFSISTDELRPAMTGIYFNFSDRMTAVSTNGFTLSSIVNKDFVRDEAFDCIVNKRSIKAIYAILSESELATMYFNKSHTVFVCGKYTLTSRLLDDKFPDYNSVIPTNNDIEVVLDRLTLITAISRVSIMANKSTNALKFTFDSNSLVISSENVDYGNSASEIISFEYEKEAFTIGFNSVYFLNILKNISSKEVRVTMSIPSRCALIFPVELQENIEQLFLLMPIKI